MVTIYVFLFYLQFSTLMGRRQRKWNSNWLYHLFFLFATCLVFSSFSFLLLLFVTEEVSARIVQVVTAEAVAVLKGEQEKEAQHKDQPAALPLGKWETASDQRLCPLHPDRRIKSSVQRSAGPGPYSILPCNNPQRPLLGCTGTVFTSLNSHCGLGVVFRVISLELDFVPKSPLIFLFQTRQESYKNKANTFWCHGPPLIRKMHS